MLISSTQGLLKKHIAIGWPVLISFAVLYFPVFFSLANGLWNEEAYEHGPIVLIVVLWLFWHKKSAWYSVAHEENIFLGSLFLAAGLLLYVIGRTQTIILLEVVSLFPVLIGSLLILCGKRVVKELWFPLFFLVFLIPLPGFLIDALTTPLKNYISVMVENIFYFLGYPIARNGVILIIGPYQLLIANACSGINSMYSLSAMGLLYVYLMNEKNMLRNSILLLSILPVAFLANLVRVMVLVLITYHFGDEAGQGFLHGFAGIVLFIIALSVLFGLDKALGLFPIFKKKK